MFCENCGEKIKDSSVFCSKCGSAVEGKEKTSKTETKNITSNNMKKNVVVKQKISIIAVLGIILTSILGIASIYFFIKMKTEFLGWIIGIAVIALSIFLQKLLAAKAFKTMFIIFSVTLVVVAGSFAFTTDLKREKNSSSTDETKNSKNDAVSSIVSIGANNDDLGNIINGQYFFDDGETQYYSSFDKNNVPHIYKKSGSKDAIPIFDGFGWSLVVYDDWLYFSGNEGFAIDGTYNLFRIKTDGSNKEIINTGYCYNMSFYNDSLYYMKGDPYTSSYFSFCRSSIDGANEEILFYDSGYCGVIFEKKIYFMDANSYISIADPDGSNAEILVNEPVNFFIIGNGNLIYIDQDSNIMRADIDGENIKKVKDAESNTITNINSYKNTIFYVSSYVEYVEGRSAFKYYLNRIDLDGSNDKEIYQGVSYGYYINVLKNSVFVLDYAIDPDTGIMIAVAKEMDLKGNGVSELDR